MIIYQGVGQEIGHIQRGPGNLVPTESDGGGRGRWEHNGLAGISIRFRRDS